MVGGLMPFRDRTTQSRRVSAEKPNRRGVTAGAADPGSRRKRVHPKNHLDRQIVLIDGQECCRT
jgi:hypothetical protein